MIEIYLWGCDVIYIYIQTNKQYALFILQVFWIGPLVGGSVAAILYEYFFSAGATFTRTKKCLTRSKVPPSSPEKPLVAAPEDAEVIEIEEKKDLDQEQDDPEKTNQTDGQ